MSEVCKQGSIDTLLLIGCGLIGGSFALAVKRAGKVRKIIGYDRHFASAQRALALGLIDTIADTPEPHVPSADFVLLATPVAQTERMLRLIAPHLQAHTIISDCGSTKSDVTMAARNTLGERVGQFVPAHPIAGREQNGPDAALPDLFCGKKTVITAMPENAADAVEQVAALWRSCGAIIHRLTPQEHDAVFASVSHLPHLLAYALVDEIARKSHADTLFQYAASGFRDFTRIAGSSPEMWRDISLANRTALLQELDAYQRCLQSLRNDLERADGKALEAMYANAQQARHAWINAIETAERQAREGGD